MQLREPVVTQPTKTALYSARRAGDLTSWIPSPATGGPWRQGFQHGGPPAGLLARAAERAIAGSGLSATRLSIDLHSPIPQRPLEVLAEVARQGRRVAVVASRLLADGSEVARATALFLRPADHPPLPSFLGAGADLPAPDLGQEVESMIPRRWAQRLPPGFHFEVEVRWSQQDQRPAAWIRMPMALVEGENTTPFQRAAILADFGNAVTGRSRQLQADDGFGYINVDINLHLVRPPVGDWIGLWTQSAMAEGGISQSQVAMYDDCGRCGTVGLASLLQPRSPGAAQRSVDGER